MHLTHIEIQKRLPLYKALFAAKPELPVVEKAATAVVQTRAGGTYVYSYADLADMEEAITPVLHNHGLMTDFEKHTDADGKEWLYGMLIHVESGTYKTSTWQITGHTNQDRGADITYGRRYLTGILTGVITDKDTDGKRTSDAPTREAEKPAPKRPRNLATAKQLREMDDLAREGHLPNVAAIVERPGISREDITKTEADKVIAAAHAARDQIDDTDPIDE
jgi:hypothetical protein